MVDSEIGEEWGYEKYFVYYFEIRNQWRILNNGHISLTFKRLVLAAVLRMTIWDVREETGEVIRKL